MCCFIPSGQVVLENTGHFKHESELHNFLMSQNWKILAYVFKENHQLLWLLPRQRLILDVAGFCKL